MTSHATDTNTTPSPVNSLARRQARTERSQEALERKVAQLEALLLRRADLQYLSLNEVAKRYRIRSKEVRQAVLDGVVAAAFRERGRGGNPCYLIRADEAERQWGSGLPVC